MKVQTSHMQRWMTAASEPAAHCSWHSLNNARIMQKLRRLMYTSFWYTSCWNRAFHVLNCKIHIRLAAGANLTSIESKGNRPL